MIFFCKTCIFCAKFDPHPIPDSMRDLLPTIAGFADEGTLLQMRLASREFCRVATRALRRDPRVRRWLDLLQFLNSDDPRPTKEISLGIEERAIYVSDTWVVQGSDKSTLIIGGKKLHCPKIDNDIYRVGDKCAVENSRYVLSLESRSFMVEERLFCTRVHVSERNAETDSLCGFRFFEEKGKIIAGDKVIGTGHLLGGAPYGIWVMRVNALSVYEHSWRTVIRTPHFPRGVSPYLVVWGEHFYDRFGRKSVRKVPYGDICDFDVNIDNDWMVFNKWDKSRYFGIAIRYSAGE